MLCGFPLSSTMVIWRSGILLRVDLENLFVLNGRSCNAFRTESDAKITADHRKNLVCGSNFHIRRKPKVVFVENRTYRSLVPVPAERETKEKSASSFKLRLRLAVVL